MLLVTGAVLAPQIAATAAPSHPDKSVSAMLTDAIDVQRAATGMVAGFCWNGKQRVVSYGHVDGGKSRPVDGNTVFNIASLTKLFTALILADMIVHREVVMDDPIAKYLPPNVSVPRYNSVGITFGDLATYASGLSGWPPDFPVLTVGKPFPDYSIDRLLSALSAYKLTDAPGTKYAYSNFAYGLLGVLLARLAKTSYEALVRSRVCEPLGMTSTEISLTPSVEARLAPGHDSALKEVVPWNYSPAFHGAGAFFSTVNDLLKFLEAAMGLRRTGLDRAFALLLQKRRPTGEPNVKAAAGWFVTNEHRDELIWKGGNTLGYASFIGYSRRYKLGAILLANGECPRILFPLGWHLLNAEFPLSRM
jgi:CubicO group peptidase (beta-lactamase class C family)